MTPNALRLLGAARIVVYNGANYDPWVEQAPFSNAPRRPYRNQCCRTGGREERRQSASVVLARGGSISRKRNCKRARYVRSRKRGRLHRAARRICEIAHWHPGKNWPHPGASPRHRNHSNRTCVRLHGSSARDGNAKRALSARGDERQRAKRSRHRRIQQDLKERKVAVLLFNKQASTELTQRMLEAARRAQIPVVGVTELQPLGSRYQDWMLMQLDELQKALIGRSQ